MTTKTIDCIDCGESVPYGRLSCPACGALLASVAGALQTPVRVVVHAETEPAVVAVEPPRSHRQTRRSRIPTPDRIPEPAPTVEPEPVALAETAEPAEPEPVGEPAELAGPADVAAAVAMPQPSVSALGATEPPRWPPLDEPEVVLAPGPYRIGTASAPNGPATSAAAYRPPAFALATATSAGRSWPVFGGSVHLDGTVPTAASTAEATADDTTETETDPAARYVELAGWFVVVGAALSALGFLLPWSRVVIGAAHIGGYFDSWGLASPSHVVVLAGLLVVLALGVIRTSVPAWLRTGVLGLAAGGILIGLAWPYVVGPLGADVGVTVVMLGGVALGIGGVVGCWATRHASEAPSV